MFEYGPYELFNRDHRGWLVSRFWRQEPLYRTDVERVLKNDPDIMSDPIANAIVEAYGNGKLYRPRGRKKFSLGATMNLMLIDMELRELADRIRWLRNMRPAGARKKRSEYSPRDKAANLMAKKYGFGSRHVLLNRITTQRKRYPLFL